MNGHDREGGTREWRHLHEEELQFEECIKCLRLELYHQWLNMAFCYLRLVSWVSPVTAGESGRYLYVRVCGSMSHAG